MANFTQRTYGNPERSNFFKNLKIRPLTEIRNYWVTNCPNCSYILRFIRSAGVKEIVDEPTGKGGSGEFNEYNRIYKYNYYEHEKPYMDYNDYFEEITGEIKNKIVNAFNIIKIEDWRELCSNRRSKTLDGFKFMIRFISYLEKYCNSQIENTSDKEVDMPIKIKKLNFPEDLENSLIEINKIRNKAVHGTYELSPDDDIKIDDTFAQLLLNLIIKQIKPLNLKSIQIKEEYDFINPESVYMEIQSFLNKFLLENFRVDDFYKKIWTPVLEIIKKD